MAGEKKSILRRFNRSAAGSYDTHALVQRSMADRLVHLLAARPVPAGGAAREPAVLEIGCGTGILTEKLLRHLPCASLTAIDLAPAMIEAAKQRVVTAAEATSAAETRGGADPARSCGSGLSHGCASDPGRGRGDDLTLRSRADDGTAPAIHFLAADVETWAAAAPAASFDLIVSNACFQWLRRPEETLGHLRRLLRPGGLLAFTTFGPDTFRELHAAFAAVYCACGLEPQRHGLSFRTVGEWKQMLKQAGFTNVQCDRSLQTECYPTVGDFLHSVKGVGASASEAQAPRGLGARRLFAGMYKEYERHFSIPGGVAATNDLLFIHAVLP
ncbi:malonyl-ACP O-methyltransferase [Paenibacillus beijingensis]|uniref:Malonyl-[acyl-carrier protein] O-methyltransferase n=1 Tax=Paenibacillus beijingensis TaxID=1126833 RepID=A0A0D5NIC0_9BACL|nr:malonyl-ACP O-methyltransferase [Paenibacillus beijingensis]AJY74717.1 hypothetical protein VN24_09130 [Paenibacillus beijingensis]